MRKSLRRASALALAAVMLLGMCLTASAAQPVTITLDGNVIETGAYVDSHDRTQAPAAVAEALGMTVIANSTSATYVSKNGAAVKFQGNTAGNVAMDTQYVDGYVPIAYLSAFFGYGITWDGAARTVALTSPADAGLSANDVVSIQATTDMCFYGKKLVQVDVTYAPGTDLSAVSPSTYTLYGRGSANPCYTPARIVNVTANGSVVTIEITRDTEATGERSRNSIGALTTAAWYIGKDGKLYYGSEETKDPISGDTYYPNPENQGYQSLPCLDLVLCQGSESFADGLALSNGFGEYSNAEKWLPTVELTTDAFATEYVNVNSAVSEASGEAYTAPGYEAFNGEVPVIVHAPDDYAAVSHPMVVYVCGGGTSYWELYNEDGSVRANNPGTNLNFDAALTNWLDEDVIIISPHVHSSGSKESAAREVAAVVDAMAEKYHADEDKIIFVGNSNGCAILSDTIRMYPGMCDVFLPCNGDLGANDPPEGVSITNRDSLYAWTEDELKAMAEHGTAIWFHTGETDARHFLVVQKAYEKILPYYKAAGFSDEWIQENIRITGYMSWQYKYWGESDHSSTRLVWGKYADRVYTDVYEGQADLAVGDTYKIGTQADFDYEGADNFVYTLYGMTPHEWALSRGN